MNLFNILKSDVEGTDNVNKNISSTKKEYEQSKREDNKKPESKSKWL